MTEQELPQKLDLKSMDIAQNRIDELRAIFPEVVTEGKIDFDALKRALGEWVEPNRERFGLNWIGKADCMKVIQQPSIGTLNPDLGESVDFEHTNNIFIEGDNLEVLKLLQKSYFGKIKMIYIDPPYNTGNEFIYPDKFSENLDTYLEYSGQKDSQGRKFSTNTDTSGRYHTNWLNMMYPRLYLARNLLKEDGVIFISIGQDELSTLIHLCFDIFGEENLVTICSRVMKTGGQKGVHFSPSVDYILIFARNIKELAQFREPISQNVIDKVYTKVETVGEKVGKKYRAMGLYQAMLDVRANQRYYIEAPDGKLIIPPGNTFPEIKIEGEQIRPNDDDGVWRWTYSRYVLEKQKNNIEFIKSEKSSLILPDGSPSNWNIYYKIWLEDRIEDGQLPGNITEKFESRHASSELKELNIPFDFAKPSALIKYLMSLVSLKGHEIVMDFFAGSASTAHGVLEYSSELGEDCSFICVQLPERTKADSEEFKAGFKTIADISRERIRRAGKKIKEEASSKLDLSGNGEIDVGFKAFKLTNSNFKVWDGNIDNDEAIVKQLELNVHNINDDRNDLDFVFEILLKSGFALDTKIENIKNLGEHVYGIANNELIICLEKEITKEMIDAIADYDPIQVICLDAGFNGNDQLKTNAVQTFKSKSRSTETEIVFKTV